MEKRDRKGRERRSARKTSKRISVYAAELCALAVSLGAAFFAPQFLFQMQDGILWEKTWLSERERVDVEGLGTAYERSLPVRMLQFAEGLAAENSFYVNETSLFVSEDIYEYLDTDILYQEMISSLVDGGLLSYNFWKMDYTVNQWKQYVIYSDDYARGVNFMLWYVELQDVDGVLLKLLTDAEGSTIYALKTENNRFYDREKASVGYDYLREYWRESHVSYELWTFFALYYQSVSEDELAARLKEMEERVDFEINDSELAVIYGESAAVGENAEGKSVGIGIGIGETGEALWHLDEEDTMSYRLSYGDVTLEAVMKVEDVDGGSTFVIQYPNITMGIRQIYEMIPEFA